MFKKIDYYFNKLVEYLGMMLLLIMTVIVSWVVFSRFILNKTPAWGEEGALLCMVWFGFLCMALGVRDNRHISIEFYDKYLTPTAQKILLIIKRLLILAFSIFMIVEGTKMSKVAAKNQLPGIKIKSSYLYLPVVLGGILICYYILTSYLRDNHREEESDT